MSHTYAYTDHTTLYRGKYKYKKLHEVPIDYLLQIYENKDGVEDKALIAYIENNFERILVKKEGGQYVLDEEPKRHTCTKTQYISKKRAREALQEIRNTPGDHKKPIRSYECPHCNAWHLTSMPYEVWKKIKRLIKSSL